VLVTILLRLQVEMPQISPGETVEIETRRDNLLAREGDRTLGLAIECRIPSSE